MKLASIVLAAGLSSRMGVEKLLLPFGEGTILEATLSRINKDKVDHLVVVTRREIQVALNLPANVTVILNGEPHKGQSESLRMAVSYIQSNFEKCQGILVFLGDHPLTQRCLIDNVINCLRKTPGAIVVPEYLGAMGHPVGFGSRWFSQLKNQDGDMGGRRIIAENPESVIRIPGDETCVMDMDSKADYRRILEYVEKYE